MSGASRTPPWPIPPGTPEAAAAIARVRERLVAEDRQQIVLAGSRPWRRQRRSCVVCGRVVRKREAERCYVCRRSHGR
jgi:hypothetical protein